MDPVANQDEYLFRDHFGHGFVFTQLMIFIMTIVWYTTGMLGEGFIDNMGSMGNMSLDLDSTQTYMFVFCGILILWMNGGSITRRHFSFLKGSAAALVAIAAAYAILPPWAVFTSFLVSMLYLMFTKAGWGLWEMLYVGMPVP